MSERWRNVTALIAIGCMAWSAPVFAQRTKVDPGMNLFSKKDDIEMGREAAAEAEKSLHLLDDRRLNDYVSEVGNRVAAVSAEPSYPYRFKVIDSSEANAFALPGGFIYLNRGILDRAESEDEVAGVLAHEVAHVTLRHGTNQLTKQVLIQVPLALVTGVAIKDDTGWKAGLARLGIQLGATGLFMSYSRKAETQSDILAAQSLYDAGYDPRGMARFFAKLKKEQGSSPGKVERFFASHPVPEDREQRVEQEVKLLGQARPARDDRADAFAAAKSRLAELPPPPESKAGAGKKTGSRPSGGSGREPAIARSQVPPPARRWTRFESPDGRVSGRMPSNWTGRTEQRGVFSLGPAQGWDEASGNLAFGVRLRFERSAIDGGRRALEAALDREVERVLGAQQGARERRRSRGIVAIDGADAARAILTLPARDGDGAYEELVGVLVRPLDDSTYGSVLVYLVAPREVEEEWGEAFDQVLQELRFR